MSEVSIVIPCLNEGATIRMVMEAIYRQTYARNRMEVIIADGLSTDDTRHVIAGFQQEFPELTVRIIDNPRRIIPAGLNLAIRASSGEIIIRMDGHCLPAEDYVEKSITALQAGLGNNVGGIWLIKPGNDTWIARSIAAAASHPFGVGDALYRYTRTPGAVDTVPFGAFRKTTIQDVGYFDETLLTNEDYEFNARLRQKGGTIWLDPSIQSTYIARSTLKELARQYWRYGYWKLKMLKRFPATLRWRQALPPMFVAAIMVLTIAGIFWWLARWAWILMVSLYLLTLILGALPVTSKKHDLRFIAGIPLAIATMHFSWGAGFIWSLMN
jgi:succinoglycan biosynthesis protein ExoA